MKANGQNLYRFFLLFFKEEPRQTLAVPSVSCLSVTLPCGDWNINLIHVYTVPRAWQQAVNHTELGPALTPAPTTTWTYHPPHAQRAVPLFLYLIGEGRRRRRRRRSRGLWGGDSGVWTWGHCHIGRWMEERWMAVGKCYSSTILSASLPTLSLSSSPSFSSCLSSSYFSAALSLYLPALRSLCCLLRGAASVCFSLSRFLIRHQ